MDVDNLSFTGVSMEKLGTYVHKQVELTELIRKKHESHSKEPTLSKTLSEQVLLLGNEVRTLAKELTRQDDAQFILKSFSSRPYLMSLDKQGGGFIEIQRRFKNRQLKSQDILAVLRFARNQITKLSQSSSLSQSLNPSKI